MEKNCSSKEKEELFKMEKSRLNKKAILSLLLSLVLILSNMVAFAEKSSVPNWFKDIYEKAKDKDLLDYVDNTFTEDLLNKAISGKNLQTLCPYLV